MLNLHFFFNFAFLYDMAKDLKLGVVVAKCTFMFIGNQILDVGCRMPDGDCWTPDALKDFYGRLRYFEKRVHMNSINERYFPVLYDHRELPQHNKYRVQNWQIQSKHDSGIRRLRQSAKAHV